ncbi:tRNA pseudouridine synthase A isoform X2 [Octopus sinensis]|uniref:Pseudouridylate synthase 1 homolog n=1 Tax=Octopus sinensis TaxID=2607531 RepID=A0A6P7T302_9MOLL|nr:tRNA pseudouridine synthase A isoform X2 [Octopus sinensis]
MLKRIVSKLVLRLRPRKMLEVLTTSEAAAVKQETDDKTAMKRQHDDDDNDDSKTPSKLLKKSEANIPIRTDRKRKVALLMAYSGEGYYGIQVNSAFPTIESELFKALVAVGLVPQDHVDNPYKMSFQRAARTDKGVSAIGQVVSLKMLIHFDNLIDRLNETLPKQIRILGMLRTTNSFNSKNHCSHRTYIYVMPTFALTPVEENVVLDYRIEESKLEELNSVLSLFKGTHNFHNFTSGRKFSDPSANRYIMDFEAGKPVVIDGLELVTIRIQGQSFMLHHIRKMIGLSIAIVRGFCGKDVIDLAWKAEKVDVPKAPGLGLVLERLHYNGYNKRFGNDGIHEPLVWDKYDEQMENFKEEFIMKNIVEKEKEEKSLFKWLPCLHHHCYKAHVGPIAGKSSLHHAMRKLYKLEKAKLDVAQPA